MLSRIGLGILAIAVIALMSAVGAQQGCRDLKSAWFHLAYYPQRDMRSTVVVAPQRDVMRGPDSLSVPTTGRDWQTDRAVLEATFHNPESMSDSSVARGQRKFQKTCIPCHGTSMKGD